MCAWRGLTWVTQLLKGLSDLASPPCGCNFLVLASLLALATVFCLKGKKNIRVERRDKNIFCHESYPLTQWDFLSVVRPL